MGKVRLLTGGGERRWLVGWFQGRKLQMEVACMFKAAVDVGKLER